MPRRKFIDKRTATTFALVHRAQNDPLINDDNATPMVFAQTFGPRAEEAEPPASSSAPQTSPRPRNVTQRANLEQEFASSVRPNEGEAAEHGVLFDDTEYDYMQHMRDLGEGNGAVTWVDAGAKTGGKRRGRGRLEDALRDMDVNSSSAGDSGAASTSRSLLPEDVLPSEFVRKRTYQDQQDVPDAIAGLQPDMDARLREALEALEDEAYVEDDEDDFADLVQGGEEVDEFEFERLGEQMLPDDTELDLGWESDDTIRAPSPPPPPPPAATLPLAPPTEAPADPQAPLPLDPTGGAWQAEIAAFKSAANPPPAHPSAAPSALSTLASARRKKRPGARTSTSHYSMTSSALARTAAQTLLDARFDRLEALYAEEEEEGAADAAEDVELASVASGASHVSRYSAASSGLSRASGLSAYSRDSDVGAPRRARLDFDGVMDEFLGGYGRTPGGRRVRRGKPMTGMEQLDEVRGGLGPARVKART